MAIFFVNSQAHFFFQSKNLQNSFNKQIERNFHKKKHVICSKFCHLSSDINSKCRKSAIKDRDRGGRRAYYSPRKLAIFCSQSKDPGSHVL